MNNGPTKKQKTNPGAQVTPVQPKGDIPKFLIDMAHRFSTDLFMHTIKDLSFKTLSMFHMLLNNHGRLVGEGLSETDIKLLSGLIGKLLSPAAKDTWMNLLIELNKMDPSIIVEAPAGHENDALWYFRAVMQASHAIYQRQNDEIAFLKRLHPNHKQWLVIDTQDINANEVTLEFLMTRHQKLDAFNESIIMSKIDLQSNRLNLNRSGITRIPESLFSDESLAVYWKNVVNFSCSNNNLQYLPKELGNLAALEWLHCGDNQLQLLPESIGRLVRLQELYCGSNQLQQLPDSIGRLATLQSLDCHNNQLQRLPDSIGSLVALQVLYCYNNQLQQLPDSIGNLVALEWLNCADNQLRQLPDSIGNLVALQSLVCNNNHLQQLPDSIGNLVTLQELYCGGNQLQKLPDSIGNLAALRVLYCYSNQLQQLPDSIGSLLALEELGCADNQLQQLPGSIGNLVALQWLQCKNNQLQQLPDSIGNLVALQMLYCDNNQLQQLPDSISGLLALEELDCGHNQLQQLPGSIGNLVALQWLQCKNNQLQQLPDSIGNLAALHALTCADNQLQCLPDNLRQKFGEVWFKQTLATQVHPTLQPPLLPAYAAAVAQTQQGEKRTERSAETLDAEKETNNTDALKRHKP